MMSFFNILQKQGHFFIYRFTIIYKHSTKLKIKKNDVTVITLSVPPTFFQLVALLKSKSYHKYDDLKKKSDCIKLYQEKMYKDNNRKIQKEKDEVH